MRDFSVHRYQPMLRLMNQEDANFLESQPGYRPEIGRAWKRARRRALRLYLRSLTRDFHRLHREASRMVADASAEHSELVGALLRQKWTFYRVRTILELRLILHWVNIGRVDLEPLLDVLQEMQAQLHPPQTSLAAG